MTGKVGLPLRRQTKCWKIKENLANVTLPYKVSMQALSLPHNLCKYALHFSCEYRMLPHMSLGD